MNKVLFFIFFNCAFFIVPCALPQNPLVKMWDKRFGGTWNDLLYKVCQTSDHGFILAGYSLSYSGGDKTQNLWGGGDFWIVKTDSLGNKQWDRDFGGTNDDELHSIQQTSDGGYILGGYSTSGISGNKTQPVWGATDYWIVKTDSLGNIQWDKDFGGSNTDLLYTVRQTLDGGYILGGLSWSGQDGDKSEPSQGNSDYWIVKTDASGIKQWDKRYGGTSTDMFTSLMPTADGGYILGGFSYSGVSGDKTQPNLGGHDYWIVKTDASGIKLWDKSFGGFDDDVLSSVQQTADGGYIIAGSSYSSIGGDKSQNSWGSYDFWMLKTDSLGNKEWDKDLGGTDTEESVEIFQTLDGGYLLSGDTYSPIGGDKSEANLGSEQTWAVKTNSLGIKTWDKTLLSTTADNDESCAAIQTADGCYLLYNHSDAGIGGDKSEASRGMFDYWIAKFCDTTHVQSIFFSTSDLCPGTCTDFLNLSLNATSYLWSFPGASPDTSTALNPDNICYNIPGNYAVTLIAFNASGSDTLSFSNYITVYPSPPPQSITQSGDTLFAIAGSATYQWYFNGNIINGATNYFYVAPASGDYNVVATDVNGCEVEAAVFNVMASVNAIGDYDILIYPNPVGDQVKIQIPIAIGIKVTRGTAVEISIYDVFGVLVVQLPTAYCLLPTCQIDVSNLPSGLYYIEIKSSGKIFRAKFVKQ